MWRSRDHEWSTVLSAFFALPGRKAVRHVSPEQRSADECCGLLSSPTPAGRGGLAAGVLCSYSTWEVRCFQFCSSLLIGLDRDWHNAGRFGMRRLIWVAKLFPRISNQRTTEGFCKLTSAVDITESSRKNPHPPSALQWGFLSWRKYSRASIHMVHSDKKYFTQVHIKPRSYILPWNLIYRGRPWWRGWWDGS